MEIGGDWLGAQLKLDLIEIYVVPTMSFQKRSSLLNFLFNHHVMMMSMIAASLAHSFCVCVCGDDEGTVWCFLMRKANDKIHLAVVEIYSFG